MKHQSNRFPLTTWLATVALCLLLAAPGTLATAAPADAAPSGSLLAWAADCWSSLAGGWWTVAADTAAAPTVDPNGFSATPLPEDGLTTAETPEEEGDTVPTADPNG